MADVASVIAAQTIRRYRPYPSRSRLRSPTRRTGTPRSRAARASAAVLTPSRSSSWTAATRASSPDGSGTSPASAPLTSRIARAISRSTTGLPAGSSSGHSRITS
ncbi:hypothetical protein [Actinomadura madurae]|uniref:hypothetical protein n=1 Tax=Actinomadura madurae TaxID=1993 RepID=UPI0020D2082E|nr:hypothetical protein [Actinomadura madurae]MCP9976688.1 hypothetical protein [Actinomadura madurae]MCQ0011819.1 hypothetical protein [Actinomadura madurae]